MAGTSWDRLGQTERAFELVAPALRRFAEAEGARLREFFRDDPVWRLEVPSGAAEEAAIDVSWSEEQPEEYAVTVIWWDDDKPRREEVGTFTRDRSLYELESLLRDGASRLLPRT
jgi:hypothetical protein